MTQHVFENLLANSGRRLLQWDPEKGSAATYFGLITERLTDQLLASRRKSPWTEEPSELKRLDSKLGENDDLERRINVRQWLDLLGHRMLMELNDRDRKLFNLLYIQQLDDQAVRQELGLNRDALYQARRRLLGRVHKLAVDMGPEHRVLTGVAQ